MDSIDTHELLASIKGRSQAKYPPIRELVIVTHGDHARAIGFRNDRRFAQDPSIVAWWPSCDPSWVRGHRFHRVTIYDVRRYASDRERESLEEVMHYLRHCLEPNGVWMEF